MMMVMNMMLYLKMIPINVAQVSTKKLSQLRTKAAKWFCKPKLNMCIYIYLNSEGTRPQK